MRSTNARRGTDSVVKMVIRVGKDEVPLGECHPAQARNLVKKEYASWDDGKLLILARPAFLKLAEGDHWVLPNEKPDVSDRELDRRKIWFKDFMTQAVKAIVPSADDKPRHLPVSPAVPKDWADVKQRAQYCAELADRKEAEQNTPDLLEDNLEQLWEIVPDVSRIFGGYPSAFHMKASEGLVEIEPQDPDIVLDIEHRERVKQFVLSARIPLSNEVVVVAEELMGTFFSEDSLADESLEFGSEMKDLSEIWKKDDQDQTPATEEECTTVLEAIGRAPGRTLHIPTTTQDDLVVPLRMQENFSVLRFSGEGIFFTCQTGEEDPSFGNDEFGDPIVPIPLDVKPAFDDDTVWKIDSPQVQKDLEAARAAFDSMTILFEELQEKK